MISKKRSVVRTTTHFVPFCPWELRIETKIHSYGRNKQRTFLYFDQTTLLLLSWIRSFYDMVNQCEHLRHSFQSRKGTYSCFDHCTKFFRSLVLVHKKCFSRINTTTLLYFVIFICTSYHWNLSKWSLIFIIILWTSFSFKYTSFHGISFFFFFIFYFFLCSLVFFIFLVPLLY